MTAYSPMAAPLREKEVPPMVVAAVFLLLVWSLVCVWFGMKLSEWLDSKVKDHTLGNNDNEPTI